MSSLNHVESHPPVGRNEALRQYELDQYHILDTPPDKEFDDLAQLASLICETPISAVSLIDHERQWYKAVVGVDIKEMSRDLAFCAYTIESDDLMVVRDLAEDDRFRENPFVTSDPRVRFYAGAPLVNPNGFALGTVCVIDNKPRELSEVQLDALRALGRIAASMLENHRTRRDLVDVITDRDAIWDYLESFGQTVDVERQKVAYPSAGLVGASVVAGGFIGYALGTSKRGKVG